MIAALAARAGVSAAAIKVILALAGGLILVVAVLSYGASREREGRRKADAEWMAANARMQADTIRATNAANALARAREAKDAETIEDLKHEAAKGTAEPVGPGVLGVIERMRREGSR